MGIFSATMQQMLFLFTIIVIGFVLAKCNILPKNVAGVLAKLENTVFIPALVMGTFIQNFTVERLGATWKLFLASFALMVVVLPLAIFIPKLLSKDDFVRKIYTYGLAFSNFGFMGNSVVAAIFPRSVLEISHLYTSAVDLDLPMGRTGFIDAGRGKGTALKGARQGISEPYVYRNACRYGDRSLKAPASRQYHKCCHHAW